MLTNHSIPVSTASSNDRNLGQTTRRIARTGGRTLNAVEDNALYCKASSQPDVGTRETNTGSQPFRSKSLFNRLADTLSSAQQCVYLVVESSLEGLADKTDQFVKPCIEAIDTAMAPVDYVLNCAARPAESLLLFSGANPLVKAAACRTEHFFNNTAGRVCDMVQKPGLSCISLTKVGCILFFYATTTANAARVDDFQTMMTDVTMASTISQVFHSNKNVYLVSRGGVARPSTGGDKLCENYKVSTLRMLAGSFDKQLPVYFANDLLDTDANDAFNAAGMVPVENALDIGWFFAEKVLYAAINRYKFDSDDAFNDVDVSSPLAYKSNSDLKDAWRGDRFVYLKKLPTTGREYIRGAFVCRHHKWVNRSDANYCPRYSTSFTDAEAAIYVNGEPAVNLLIPKKRTPN
nr:hypothetical protein [Endozoicomonas sp.]